MRFLIIGDGVAGHNAALTLRKNDPDAEIVIFTEEAYPFYDRVRLKKYLEGTMPQEKLILADQNLYRKYNIDLKLKTKIESLDPKNKRISVNGEYLGYDKLLIATGGSPINIFPKVYKNTYLFWNMDHAIRLNKALQPGKLGIVIGGARLGMVMTHVFVKRKLKTTFLIRGGHWNRRCFSYEFAEIFHEALRKYGVDLRLKEEMQDHTVSNGKITEIITNKGVIKPDIVGVAIGIRRNLSLAQNAGLKTNQGIIADKYLQTSNKHIYAAGDVVEFFDPIFREYNINGSWSTALEQGKTAALNILGQKKEFRMLDYYAINYFGLLLADIGEITVKGEVLCRRYGNAGLQLTLQNNRVRGAAFVNDIKRLSMFKKLIETQRDVSSFKDKLLDPDFTIQ